MILPNINPVAGSNDNNPGFVETVKSSENLLQTPSQISQVVSSPSLRKHGSFQGAKNILEVQDTFVSQKEKNNKNLILKLQSDGVIITSRLPFEKFNQIKILDLISHGLFKFELYN